MPKNLKTVKRKKDWITGAISKPGALKKQLGVAPEKTIPPKKLAAAATKGGVLGKRANLAITLKKLSKGKSKKKGK